MRHIFYLRYYCLLANNAMAMVTVMLRHLFVASFVGGEETNPNY